jgi:hypothetical protein
MVNRLVLYFLLVSTTFSFTNLAQAQARHNVLDRSSDSSLHAERPTIMQSLMHLKEIKPSDILAARKFNRRNMAMKQANNVEVISSKVYARFSHSKKYNSFESEYDLTILLNKYQLGTEISFPQRASRSLYYVQPTVKTIHTYPSYQSLQLECQAGLSMASSGQDEMKVEQLNPQKGNRLFGLFSWVGKVAIKLNLNKSIKNRKRK